MGALLAAAEQEDLGAAVELAQQAVGADAGLIRARIVLARALLASQRVQRVALTWRTCSPSRPGHAGGPFGGAPAARREAPQPAAAEEPGWHTAVVDAGVAADL
ncbi:MAG: hypothetical protein IPH72_07945 [Sandaracinaceae bacterium]|nr:hypothetical protein [Sandaracinaceae bacterium]